MKVPFLDVGSTYRELAGEIDEAVSRVLNSGWYLFGNELEAFEQSFARFIGVPHCIGVASGLDAITLILRALPVGPGDEVIVPSNTCIATWMAVSRTGATLVPVEPRPATCNIDPQRIEAAISPRTRVILPVHLYGQAADMDPILEIAQRHGLAVVEDAAQAHGARYKGVRCGGLARAAGFSFYPAKNLGAFGDGGAITTHDDDLARQLRLLRNYGSPVRNEHQILGTNSRLSELQAAVLSVKLRQLEAWNQQRSAIATRYREAFAKSSLQLIDVPDWALPVWHLFVVRTPQRDALAAHLAERGIGTLIHYSIAPHLQPAYRELGLAEGALPISEAIHREVLSLPNSPHLQDNEVAAVIEAVLEFQQ